MPDNSYRNPGRVPNLPSLRRAKLAFASFASALTLVLALGGLAGVGPRAWAAGAATAVGPAPAEKVPSVVAGAGAAAPSTRVEARIAEVTVFSDRARVRR